MSLFGAIDKMKDTISEKDETSLVITIGRVMDTNDPNQMGRIRIYIPAIDRDTSLVGDLPFAMYCSPFGGHQHVQPRGPETTYTTGPVAYGFFTIPKVGTDVVVAHLDGNPQYRIWFGALQGMYLTHTLPHGRFTFNNPSNPGQLDGPLSSTESPIQPQYGNLTDAYTRTTSVASNDGATSTTPRVNFEWRTRGMDYQAAGLGPSQQASPTQEISNIADDRDYSFTEEDGNTFKDGNFTQGYAKSRVEPNVPYDPSLVDGGVNFDPQVYSLTTPGFHAWSMDDRPENCRVRFRTTSGHTFILDDTNERIYIATANGDNWVEMDQDGSVDVYSSRRVSIHAAMDVNIKTEGAFRVDAAQGIHLNSGGDTRITTAADVQMHTTGNMNVEVTGNVGVQVEGDTNVKTSGSTNVTSGSDTNINSGANLNVQSTSDTNVKASGNVNIQSAAVINIKGQTLNLNSDQNMNILAGASGSFTSGDVLSLLGTTLASLQGGQGIGSSFINLSPSTFTGNTGYYPPGGTEAIAATSAGDAGSATAATDTTAKEAYLNNRVPEHEPWGRIMMKQSATDGDSGNNYQLELDYNSPEVGHVELGETIPRNSNWHR